MAEGRKEGRGLHKIWQRGESTSAAAVAAEITEEEGREGARLIEEQAPNMRFCKGEARFYLLERSELISRNQTYLGKIHIPFSTNKASYNGE